MRLQAPLICLLTLASTFGNAQEASEIIREIMKNQETCWNNGDLECFMTGYWESDSLLFIGKEGVHYGYENTLKRYQTAYPDRQAMGRLTFEFISMQALSGTSFYVVGKYHLQRKPGDLRGNFTLLWRKIGGEWVIVADHSS